MQNTLIRKATGKDLEFMIQADLSPEGYSSNEESSDLPVLTSDEHTEKIRGFIYDKDKGTLIITGINCDEPLGCIMYNIVNLNIQIPEYSIFHQLDRKLLPDDGMIVEIFQLWIKPEFRNQGFATILKKSLEEEAKKLGIYTIYTHTEEIHETALKLNRKLGYQEIRRGPIWDDIIRVSLIKNI